MPEAAAVVDLDLPVVVSVGPGLPTDLLRGCLTAVTELEALVRPERYPRSSTYDPAWVVSLDMGPNPLWLLEDLSSDLDLRPGMRVLDLGSGRGATSVFLAREFGVQVVAADLWIPPDEATAVFSAANVADKVLAIRAEAHSLPFGAGTFDAIVSVDAFEYFGTSEYYLAHLTRLLVPGGQLGVATPALRTEPQELAGIPAHVRDCVGWEALAWHTCEWWSRLWKATGLVTSVSCRLQQDGWEDWLLWQHAVVASKPVAPTEARDADPVLTMLEADLGTSLTFALLSARTPG